MSIRPEELGPLFTRHFGDRRLVVVSNREPYEHRWSDEVGEMDVRRPAGGCGDQHERGQRGDGAARESSGHAPQYATGAPSVLVAKTRVKSPAYATEMSLPGIASPMVGCAHGTGDHSGL